MIVTGKAPAEWVAKKLFADFNACEAIGLERRGEIVAGVVYENWNGASFVCHIVVEGLMTPRYLAAIFHYPFVHCGAAKIIAPVAESNEDSIRFCRKLGFTLESTITRAHPDGSLLLFTMEPEACRFIKGKYRGQIESSTAASA